MKRFLFMIAVLPLGSCMFHPRGMTKDIDGPFIDSTGYATSQKRIEATGWEESDALISQALSVMGDSLQSEPQADFFQSIEENYQRYLTLFTPVKHSSPPEVHCKYDLIETFRLGIFDQQPFVNAMLHTMSLTDLATLDFSVQPKNADTTLVLVALTRAVFQEGTKSFSFSEGSLTLSVTRHSAILADMKPREWYGKKNGQ